MRTKIFKFSASIATSKKHQTIMASLGTGGAWLRDT